LAFVLNRRGDKHGSGPEQGFDLRLELAASAIPARDKYQHLGHFPPSLD
jgi:hypothetical protein